MNPDLRDRTLAAAGLFQSVHLVQQVARHGVANAVFLEASLESVFSVDADSPEAVYGGVCGVLDGLKVLVAQLEGKPREINWELVRYALALIRLERRLQGTPRALNGLREGIQSVRRQKDYFSLTHTNTIARLGELYRETLGQLSPTVVVRGEANHLRNEQNAAKVRALLLAGIRSAVLWRQLGGNRWQLYLRRQGYMNTATTLLQQCPEAVA